jgi:twinkle protein
MKTHLPCPDCASSDALTDYGDHTYCFSCGAHRTEGSTEATQLEVSGNLIPQELLDIRTLSSRGISRATCEKFNYGYHGDKQIACYYHRGHLVYQKTRTADKRFSVLSGDTGGVPLKNLLFGRHLWGDGGGRRLIITEGEIDCLTAYEALGRMGFHCVSVSSGAQSAAECLKANFEFIDKYAEVYLCFDNDDPGRKATEAVTKSLLVGNIFLMNLPQETKDLNDLFKARGATAVTEAYHTATKYRPSGILTGADIMSRALEKPTFGFPWPWEGLNETTYGVDMNKFIVITAGSGVGKTTVFKSLEAHFLKNPEIKLGIIHLEEPVRDTANGLLALLTGKPFDLPDSSITDDERREALHELTRDERLVVYDNMVGFDEDAIMSAIRYLVVGLGCNLVFLDHLTAITDQYDREVNQRTRNLIVKLGQLVAALPFSLFAISHIRKADGKPAEEGGRVHLDDMLGASALKQWAHYVFAIERNNQAEDETERNSPHIRHLKNRPRGEFTGTIHPLIFDTKTRRLEERRYGRPVEVASFDF